jgi:hypothetical protein
VKIGSTMGTYEITGPRRGGDGRRLQARPDTRLKREVAIKVLPEAFASDA